MSDEKISEQPVQQDPKFLALINESGVEEATKADLIARFAPFLVQAHEWSQKAKAVQVTSIDQKHEMKEARNARLALKNIRVNVEKERKNLKEDSLRKGKAIDETAKFLISLIEPIEAHLKEQEEFEERYEAAQRAELKAKRLAELAEYDVDGQFYALDTLPEDQYQNLLTNSKEAKENKIRRAQEEEQNRIAEEQRLEKERLEREEEDRQRKEEQRLQNERLQAQADLNHKRLTILNPYWSDGPIADSATLYLLSQEEFDTLLNDKQTAHEAFVAAQKLKDEEARLQREKEQLQATRLKAIWPYSQYGPEVDSTNFGDLSTEEYESVFNSKKEAFEQHERNEKAQEEERLRVENELKEKQAEERRIREAQEAALEQELSKGDAAKFKDLIADIEALKTKYSFKSKKYQKLYTTGKDLLSAVITNLSTKK